MKLSTAYEPQKYEQDVYALWESSVSFRPKGEGEPFSIIMPPPNANAPLHIGHALFIAVQDLLTRYNRLQGKSTLYLPGADHAGFETWVVYEKHLAKEGKTRFDFTRDELFKQVWDFVEQNKGTMLAQARAMGVSADWSRFTYTLDAKVVTTAYDTFKKLWDDGLIYRGERIVNYCTKHDTSFSDIEVEYKDRDAKLWQIEYPLTDGSGAVVVATTRPETMLGDTAVAVHPKDKRYQSLVGKTVKLPLTSREIPIVADDAIDMEFGTGAVKVTPAHDQTDFDIGQRHDLPNVVAIGFDGKMTVHVPPAYRGLSVNDARAAVVKDLKKGKHLKKEAPYTHSIGVCYKCGTVIEPLLKDQWFVKMKPLAKPTMAAIKKDQVAFSPANKKDHALRYLANVRDWNISRQIAWGIPIPAFQNVDEPDDWIFDTRVEQEILQIDGKTYRRDPDVFDTWFSSGQWPFITLGYPDNEDFKKYYPTSVMETGGEIFNQWVLRMIMLGLYVTGQVPFKTVYIHGHVLAQDGTKMSKSLDNVINPMEVIDEYGSDALRMGLLSGRVAGVSSAFSTEKVVGGRNFANKLWNVSRFVEGVLTDKYEPGVAKAQTPADEWILERLAVATEQMTKLIDEYRFSEAFETLYHTLWDDFADWYLEVSKVELNKDMLAYGLQTLLVLAHPFAPFVTETVWQTLTWTDGLLITAEWPEVVHGSVKQAHGFTVVRDVITEIRDLRTRLRLRESTLYHKGNDFIQDHQEVIIKLAGIAAIDEVKSGYGLHLTTPGVEGWLDVEHSVINEYVAGMQSQLKELQDQATALQTRLDNKGYLKKAPPKLVEQTKSQLKDTQSQTKKLKNQITNAQSSLKK
jgi:valyl-tRNA synthetase